MYTYLIHFKMHKSDTPRDCKRSNSSPAEQSMRAQIKLYLDRLIAYPCHKSKVVTAPGYINERFGDELRILLKRLVQYPGLSKQLKKPLSSRGGLSVSSTFRKKLLLRDYPEYAELPRLVELLSIKEELVLPCGTIINPAAVKMKMYWLTKADREMMDKARTLFVTAVFEIAPGLMIEQKVELDLLMATPAYTVPCADIFRTQITEPNINATIASFEKHLPELLKTY